MTRFYANTEAVLVAYLSTLPGIGGVSVEKPGTTTTYPFVMVTRLPVGSSNGRTDSPTVDVEVFHPDRATAATFARTVHHAMLHLRHTVVGGVPIDDVEHISGPGWLNYENPRIQRYIASYVVQSRINAQPL